MDKKNLCDLDVAGQKVLVRVDYNVPMDETGKITDDTRIRASLETIKYLLEHKAAVILMAHLGRPKGQVNIKYSLAPVAKHLAKLLNMPVAFAGDCIGEEAEKAVQKLKPGKILMLENLRFHKEEEKNIWPIILLSSLLLIIILFSLFTYGNYLFSNGGLDKYIVIIYAGCYLHFTYTILKKNSKAATVTDKEMQNE